MARKLGLLLFSLHIEMFAAPRNDNLQRRLNLAQIFVKRATQPVQTGIVRGFQRERDGGSVHFSE